MDIYRTAETAVTGSKLKSNRGTVISGTTTNQRVITLYFYGVTGGTYSTNLILPPNQTFFIPIRTWGVSFDVNGQNAFGVS